MYRFLLTFAFVFIIGSCSGWIIELFYRRFFSKNNPERKWINPGFCVGPYLPIYGFGVSLMYGMCVLCEKFLAGHGFWGYVGLFAVVAFVMTAIELIAGLGCLKFFKIRLWDYTNEWGNFKGVICPKFTFYWTMIGVIYYFLCQPWMEKLVEWLLHYVPMRFVCGMFYGIFFCDFIYSAELVSKIKTFAEEHHVVVNYEMLKAKILSTGHKLKKKVHFGRFFKTDLGLKEMLDAFISDDGDDTNNGIVDRFKAVFEVIETRKQIKKANKENKKAMKEV